MSSHHKKKLRLKDVLHIDADFINKCDVFLDGLYRYYFRCEVSGWENVPEHKALYVGNHNGMITFEVMMMFHAWWKRFGEKRPALGLAHGIALEHPIFKWLCPKVGAIPADPDLALEALESDYSLMVYPGGEKESFRPYRERKQIHFYQRKGFIRLALKAKVPIVPLVSTGAHETYYILDRGEELAHKLGLTSKYRLHGVPITPSGLFLAWCLASGIFTILPLFLAPMALFSTLMPMPAKMNFRFLPEIDPAALCDPALSEEENLQKIYDYVIETMQKAHEEEYEKRKFPILG